MKKLWLSSMLLGAFVLLTACQASSPSSKPNEASNQEQAEETSKENKIENNENKEIELLSPDTNSQNKKAEESSQIAKVNLLDAAKKIKHPKQEIEITYTDAFFTQQVIPTGDKPEDIREIMAKDKEIYFHVIADINNDTTKSFSYGNSLGDAKVKLIYDGKHEFDFLAASENSEGTKFGPSGADPLTTTKAHYYAKVPIAVYDNADKPLELKIKVGDDEYQVQLR